MRVNKTPLSGLLVIEPDCYQDDRGFFLETFHTARYRDAGILDTFVQGNQSRSNGSVLRGLHYQIKRPQSQVVTVIRGAIFDVAVDLRKESPTFGQWYGAELSDSGPRQIYMAPGFAHGFCVLSDCADLHYQVSCLYDPDDEGGINWQDPDIGIRWPIALPNVNKRDSAFPMLREVSDESLPNILLNIKY